MKYVLMYTSRPDLDADADPETAKAIYERVYEWFGENAGVIADSGAELLGVETATTVTHGAEGSVVVDGPFNEAKEVIGGFSVIDVPDMDAAIAMVKTWPLLELPGVAVEIRPMVEDYSHMRGMTNRPIDRHGRPPRAHAPRGVGPPGGPACTAASATSTWPRRRSRRPCVEALTDWRRDGTPDRPVPGSRSRRPATRWTACGPATASAALGRAGPTPCRPRAGRPAGTDDRLALLFACCHPALAPEARLALTLRAVIGLTTPQIARAFLVNEPTLAQRIVRAKRKIVSAGIALTVPPEPSCDERLERRARRRLPHLQRGVRLLHRHHPGPRPRCRRGLAGRGGRRPRCPSEAEALGPGRAAAPSSTPAAAARFDGTATWCCSATRTARCGTRAAIARGRATARAGRRAAARRAATSSRRRSPPCHADGADLGGDRLAADLAALRRCWPATTPRPSSGSTSAVALAQRRPGRRGRPGRRRDARRAARRLPPLPRHPGRAARRAGSRRRGRRRRTGEPSR